MDFRNITYAELKAYLDNYEKENATIMHSVFGTDKGAQSSMVDNGVQITASWDYGKMRLFFAQIEKGELGSEPSAAGVAVLKTDDGLTVHEGKMYKNENGGLAIHSNKVTQYSIDGRLVETTLWNEDDSSVYTSFNQDGSKDVIKRDASGNETSKEHIEKDHNNMSFIVNDNVNASALTITVSSNKGR